MDQQPKDTEKRLLGVLQAHERRTLDGGASERSKNRADAHARYRGDPYGDEVIGRSSVTTREVFETIEWLRPDLERVFNAGERIVDIEASSPQEMEWVEQQSEYLNHVFFVDNPGEKIVDTMAFDGLLERTGYAAAFWKEADYAPSEKLTGLATFQVEQLSQDPKVELESAEYEQVPPDETHPDGMAWSVSMRRVEREAYCEVMAIPPENVLVRTQAVDLDEEPYVGVIIPMMRGEIARRWPDHKADIMDFAGEQIDEREEDRRQRWGIGADWAEAVDDNEAADELPLLMEHVRFDLDGDGYPEMVRVYRLGDMILESQEVPEQPVACWSPVTIPHKQEGMSIYDITHDTQLIKTVSTRAGLDAMYHAVTPRTAVSNKVNLDDLLAVEPGATIRVDTTQADVAGHIVPIVTPDLVPAALQMIEYIDQSSEKRTGVSRNSQGLDPDALNKTASGQAMMQNASNKRAEKIARALGSGLTVLFRKINRILIRNQQAARVVQISGKWTPIDPRAWNTDARVTVNVGQGSRETELANLSQISGMQQAWVAAFGPQTPIVTPKHMHNVAERTCRAMGYKSGSLFFGEPPEGWVPEQPPNPDMQKAQAEQAKMQSDMQMSQAKLQADMQAKQADLQFQQQMGAQQSQLKQAEAQSTLQLKQAEAQATLELERERLNAEIEMKREQMAAEFELKREQLQMEFKLKYAQMEVEAGIKERAAERAGEAQMAAARAKGGRPNGAPAAESPEMGGDVRFGGEVG